MPMIKKNYTEIFALHTELFWRDSVWNQLNRCTVLLKNFAIKIDGDFNDLPKAQSKNFYDSI